MPCLRTSEEKIESVKVKDVEEQKDEKLEGHVDSQKSKRCCTKRLMCILLSLVGVAGVATATFWPRDVNWQLTTLDVLDESSLMYFVMAFGSRDGMSNETALPEMTFHAGAAIENPNFLGGQAHSGEFVVLFKDKVLGGGKSKPVDVPARGSGKVLADVQVKLNPSLFKEITDDVLANSLHTNITVQGKALVQSIFGLKILCKMECEILARVSEIFGSTKQAVVESKTCAYQYF